MTSRISQSAQHGRRRTLAVLLTAAVVLASVAVAMAATTGTWGNAGGDAGQSGYQPVVEGALPIGFVQRQTDEGALRTQATITGGTDPSTQSVAYGKWVDASTDRNQLYIRRLDTGALRTSFDLTSGNGGTDGFGAAPGGVHPLSSSTPTASGVLFALHNDDDSPAKTALSQDPVFGFPPNSPESGNDIALAWFNEATGARLGDFGVGQAYGPPPGSGFENDQPTDGFTIESAGALGPPATDGSGTRGLFFTGKPTTGTPRIFRVNITNAGSPLSVSPNTDGPNLKDIADLNTKVTPAIAYLEDPNGAPGVERSFALLAVNAGAGGSDIRSVTNSFALANGPVVPSDIPGNPRAIAVPVTDSGLLPGQEDSGAAKATSIYVAYDDGGNTVIRRFTQEGNAPVLTEADASVPLPGAPAPGLAVTAEVVEGVQEAGKVVVATAANVYVLDADTLTETGRLQDGGPTEPDFSGTSGFTQTAPSASGNLVYLTRDDGTQIVLNLSDGEYVPSNVTGFQEREENFDATFSVGRPTIANGYIVYMSDLGTWTYRAALNPQVEILDPPVGGTVDGTVTFSARVTDPDGTVQSVRFFLDGSTTPIATKVQPDDPDDPGDPNDSVGTVYSTTYNSFQLLDGTHTITVTGRDNANTEGSSTHTFVVNNFLDPSAALKVEPSEAQPTDTPVVLNAEGSAPTPGAEAQGGETIVGYRFDLDGNGTYETDNKGNPKLTTRFLTPGSRTVRVQVTDSHGDTATAPATVVSLNRAPVPAFSGPAIIKPGGTAGFDASGSKDPDGEVTLYEWDLDGNGDFETNTGADPKASRQFPAAGTVKVSLRITDDSNAIATISKDLVVGNQNPLAAFLAIPTAATTGERVSFDASTSRDPDGGIAKYEWDLDGNGTLEVNGGNNPRTSRVYTTAGVINVKLRVTDTDGAANEVVRQITVIQRVLPRKTPRRLTLTVTPKRDAAAPFVFTSKGTLTLPTGVSRTAGCTGTVTVTVKAGNRTISNRVARLSRSCRFSQKLTFRDTKRFGRATALRFQARFRGNTLLVSRRSAAKSVRFK